MGTEDGELEPGLTRGLSSDLPPAEHAAEEAASYDEPPLVDVLMQDPYRFGFFASLRLLARIAAKAAATNEEPRPAIEQIKFRSLQALSFPPSELWDLKMLTGGSRSVEMTVAFLGLTGPMGALPRPYTELVIQRIRKFDYALRNFLDIFNHRLIEVFAQAGEKYRFYLPFEHAAAREQWRRAQGEQKLRAFFLEERPRIDLVSQILLDFGGLGTGLLRYKDSRRAAAVPRHDVPDSALRYYCGLFAQSHRSAVSLGHMLSEYFRVPANILPFVGQWIQLPLEHQTCMRRSVSENQPALRGQPVVGKCSHPQLGRNTVVGSRVWEVQGRFRVQLGPLTFDEFKHFMPIGDKYRQMAHLVRLYVGPAFDFDVQPVLKGEEAPWCQFGAKGSRAPRLGWNTWLRNRAFTRPVDDAVFRVPDQVSMSN